MSKTVRVCHYKYLKIEMQGDVYPCCSPIGYKKIGNIFDENIYDEIENAEIICECPMYKSIKQTTDDKVDIDYIHYETANLCQANCVCCPQGICKVLNPREKEHLQKINEIIEHYKPKNIVAIGGEILVQKEAFEMLFDLHKKYPTMKIETISNLCVNEETLKKAEEIFDKITVSFLGFNEHTYNCEMSLDFNKTMKNFEYLYKNEKVKLCPKYLMMPTNIFEILPFFEWALSLDVEKIYLHNIHELYSVINKDQYYWNRTFEILEKKMKKILETNKDLLISKARHFVSIQQQIADNIHINQEYIDNLGLKNIVEIIN